MAPRVPSRQARVGREGEGHLEGIVDAVNAVVPHLNEEARRELRVRGTRVEEGWGSVGEPALREEVVAARQTQSQQPPQPHPPHHVSHVSTPGPLQATSRLSNRHEAGAATTSRVAVGLVRVGRSRLDDGSDVILVDADSDTHQHVLRSLHNLLVDLEQVRPLEGLEPKVVVAEVTLRVDRLVEGLGVGLDDLL